MNITPENVDYGKIRRLVDGELPTVDEIELRAEEAKALRAVQRSQRVTALAELRRDNPVRFHYKQKRKHR